MNSELVRTICRIGVFIICAQVLVHFRPNRSYEKYLKLLVSMMILLQVLRPLTALFGERGGMDLEERAAWFGRQLEESMEEAARRGEEAELRRQQMSLEEVQRRLEEADMRDASNTQEAPDARDEPDKLDAPDGEHDGFRVETGKIAPIQEIPKKEIWVETEKGGESLGGEMERAVEEVVPQR